MTAVPSQPSARVAVDGLTVAGGSQRAAARPNPDHFVARATARRRSGHRVRDTADGILFSEGRIVCSCGTLVCDGGWTPDEMADAFQEHREAVGAPRVPDWRRGLGDWMAA